MWSILRRSVLPALLLGIVFPLASPRLSLLAADGPTEAQRLAALGKAWGLLKYYHSDVAGGTIDWDQTLVDAIPRVQAAQSRDDLNRELMTLAQTAGTTVPAAAAPGALLPTDVFGWLDDTTVINPDVAAYLKLIVTGNQPAPANRYVKGVPIVGNPVFSGDAGGYDGPTYPDQPRRLLALFRYWNMVQYYCPNRGLIDRNWGDVLQEFVPRMEQAANATEYHLALSELIANISDTHGIASSSVYWAYWGYYLLPVQTRFIQGQTVVVKVFQRLLNPNADLRVGDIITAIDGTPTTTLRAGYRKYINASNVDSLARDADRLLIRSATNATRSVSVVHDGGASATVSVIPAYVTDWYNESDASLNKTAYKMIGGTNVGYIDMGVLQSSDVPGAMQMFTRADAIVIDLRRYPNGTMWTMLPFLEPRATAMARFVQPDYARPGSALWQQPIVLGPATPNLGYYKGRLVVLMDENTQSQAEYSVMGFRSAPATTVIGSRTAGADGNVSQIKLPGGFYTYFSGITPFYPDGTPTQRIGILPDIEVRPTIAGIREGRDELMEAALAAAVAAARPRPSTASVIGRARQKK